MTSFSGFIMTRLYFVISIATCHLREVWSVTAQCRRGVDCVHYYLYIVNIPSSPYCKCRGLQTHHYTYKLRIMICIVVQFSIFDDRYQCCCVNKIAFGNAEVHSTKIKLLYWILQRLWKLQRIFSKSQFIISHYNQLL